MAIALPLPIPCLKIPAPALPTLPAGLTLGVAVPSLSFDPALCCKVVPFSVATPPLALPQGVLNAGVVVVINQAIDALNAFFDAAQFTCPLE